MPNLLHPEQQKFIDVFQVAHKLDALLGIIDKSGRILFSNDTFQEYFPGSVLDLSHPITKQLLIKAKKTLRTQHIVSYTETFSPPSEDQFAIFCFPIQPYSIGFLALKTHHFNWLTTPLGEEAQRTLTNKITELQQQIENAQRLATIDPLTKVHNRSQAKIIAKQEIAKYNRFKQCPSLIFIDVDNFKSINDTWGHNVGDSVLVEVCRLAEQNLRPFDALARWGGEEFIIILPDTGFEHARGVATRICKAIDQFPFPTVGHVTASLGVATYREHEQWNEWVDRADSAMYYAKAHGKNRVEPQNEFDGTGVPNIEESSSFLHLAWNKSFESGHPTIDQGHKELFEHSNALFDAFLNGANHEQIGELINTLMNAVEKHFSDEIKILRELGYPEVDAHEKIHANIIQQAASYVQRYQQNQLLMGELFSFLAYQVVSTHMLQEDQKFFSFIKENRKLPKTV